VRVAHLAQFYRNSICTPLLTWRTWRLSAHLAPVCAPGACLRTWRLYICYMQNLREHDGRAHLFVAMGVVPT
jgi:hypothetical protein